MFTFLNDTVSVGKPWGKGCLTHDFSGPLASRNPNTGNNSKPIGFHNRFDAFDKRKNSRGFEHENNFQEVNQQNSSTRFFSFWSLCPRSTSPSFPILCADSSMTSMRPQTDDCQACVSAVTVSGDSILLNVSPTKSAIFGFHAGDVVLFTKSRRNGQRAVVRGVCDNGMLWFTVVPSGDFASESIAGLPVQTTSCRGREEYIRQYGWMTES
jgi:hypothetical protein